MGRVLVQEGEEGGEFLIRNKMEGHWYNKLGSDVR